MLAGLCCISIAIRPHFHTKQQLPASWVLGALSGLQVEPDEPRVAGARCPSLTQVAWSELQVERVIGHGSFGRVYLAHWQETPCAVKVLLNKGEMEGWIDWQPWWWLPTLPPFCPCLAACMPTFLPARTPDRMVSWPPTCLPRKLYACLPTCLPFCLPANLHAQLSMRAFSARFIRPCLLTTAVQLPTAE